MNKNELKQEFKKKCKEEKAKCLTFINTGLFLMVLSAIVSISGVYMGNNHIITLGDQIFIVGVGVGLLIVGIIVNAIGESQFKKMFEEYFKSKSK